MTIDIDTSRRASATMPPTARNARGRQALFAALLCVPVVATAADGVAPGRLSAAQIVERNIAARGGLSAWHAVRTLSVTGKLEAGAGDSIARSERVARGSKGQGVRRLHAEVMAADKSPEAQVLLPFTLEMKQPRMSRLEIQFAGKAAVQVYDGTSGWKLRPFLNRNDVEPFTADESQAEAGKPGLEGPLVDYAAKGTTLALEGLEAVEGHDAYKLKLTLKNGTVQHVWIDANSFLDVKVEGVPRRMDGRVRTVWVYQRDFRPVQGLKVPFVYETAVDGFPGTHRMFVDTVTVNPPIADTRFVKPVAQAAASVPPAAANVGPMAAGN